MASGVENGTTAPQELETKIVKQLEYYFGDYNLPKDKFMREAIKLDDGWFTIEKLLTFNRLKALTTEASVVVEALKKSSSKLLEVSEDNKKVRRDPAKPLPECNQERQKKLEDVTVYVKRFPLDTSMDDLLEFFGKYGECVNVFMRKNFASRAFKGSVFVTFSTKEQAENFIALESVKYNEIELERCMKKDHTAEKQRQRLEREAEKAKKREKAGSAKKEAEEEADSKLNPENIILGCILKLEGLSGNVTWQDIKEFFTRYAEVAFVDHNAGNTEAAVRFADEGSASAVLEQCQASDKKIDIKGSTVTASVLEGDEELEYWKKKADAKKEKFRRSKQNRGGGRGRSRGRGGRRGGRHTRNKSEDSEKVEEDAGNEPLEGPAGSNAAEVEKPDASDGCPPPEKRAKVDGD